MDNTNLALPPGPAPVEPSEVILPDGKVTQRTRVQVSSQPSRPRGAGGKYKRDRSPYWWIRFSRQGKEHCESTGIPWYDPDPRVMAKNEQKAEGALAKRVNEVRLERDTGSPFVGNEVRHLRVNDLLDALENDFSKRGKLRTPARAHIKSVREAIGWWKVLAALSNPQELDRVILAWKKAGSSNGTINRRLQLYSQSFRLAMKQRRIAQAPVVDLLPAGPPRQGFFEAPDVEAVVAYLEPPLDDLVTFAFACGWRRGEVLGLRWEWVTADAIYLPTSKNGHGRVLELQDEDGLNTVGEIIERQRARRVVNGQMSAYVFHRDGQPVKWFYDAWRTACNKAGLDGRLFHDLRRSAVRDMIRGGTPQTVAMDISGHRSASVFARYNITAPGDRQQAMRRTFSYREGRKAKVAVMPQPTGTE